MCRFINYLLKQKDSSLLTAAPFSCLKVPIVSVPCFICTHTLLFCVRFEYPVTECIAIHSFLSMLNSANLLANVSLLEMFLFFNSDMKQGFYANRYAPPNITINLPWGEGSIHVLWPLCCTVVWPQVAETGLRQRPSVSIYIFVGFITFVSPQNGKSLTKGRSCLVQHQSRKIIPFPVLCHWFLLVLLVYLGPARCLVTAGRSACTLQTAGQTTYMCTKSGTFYSMELLSAPRNGHEAL